MSKLVQPQGYLGDFPVDQTLYCWFGTNDKDGFSRDSGNNGTAYVYKDDLLVRYTDGLTMTPSFLGAAAEGTVKIKIILTGSLYTVGSDFVIVVEGMVVDGETINAVIASFSIVNRA